MPQRLPLLLILLFVSSAVFVADNGMFPRFFRWVASVPHLDKAGHFVLMGLLAWSANLAFRHHRLCPGLLTGSLITAAVVFAEEFSQKWFPARSFDWRDLLADALGILCASMFSPKAQSPRETSPDAGPSAS